MHTAMQTLALALIVPNVAQAGDAWINTQAPPGRTLTWHDDFGDTVVGKPGAGLQLWRWPDGMLHTRKPGTWETLPNGDQATTIYTPNGEYQSFPNRDGSRTLYAPSP